MYQHILITMIQNYTIPNTGTGAIIANHDTSQYICYLKTEHLTRHVEGLL